ncbi:glutamyl-tRNA(Gln) amidotransferase subunit C, mitochondrial [Octopus bimaculoides]|uniref:Glutamyl-tRNA(Gln) amidotransferase subunit C, mitochondrial n=1 Tax=Octopus bimaculoides TaxID=37653 RepID=A0A0L8HUL9_OCTBM|nr:glutamyl-tRNA(Gln) amidotransferase subunit C, mitochondrial [Octopus bimaculoides]|eukprot:XP_014769567.1 PREDICTED: glutamyl-tRNA(Gln) amidotransferase subunit C, mitochondrial-like [Octopus bimaculoides]
MKLPALRWYHLVSRQYTLPRLFQRPLPLTLASHYSYSKEPPVDAKLVEKLERLSLVAFDSEVDVQRLRQTIKAANEVLSVDTTGIEPMISVHEDRALELRSDVVKEGHRKDAILNNATKVFEDYYVAPPGNIPLKRS